MGYTPISKCDTCAVREIPTCLANYALINWLFQTDLPYDMIFTNELGVKFIISDNTQQGTLTLDMSLFPAGWYESSSTLYVEIVQGDAGSEPGNAITFTIGDDPTTYSCFWLTFYNDVTPV